MNLFVKIIIRLIHKTQTFQEYLGEEYDYGYSQGMSTGIVSERSKVLQRLEHHDVTPFNDDAVKLGYDHAIEAVKDSLAKH